MKRTTPARKRVRKLRKERTEETLKQLAERKLFLDAVQALRAHPRGEREFGR